jgi:protein-L-isoaspartate(D-aspartate) O-methyltransferase
VDKLWEAFRNEIEQFRGLRGGAIMQQTIEEMLNDQLIARGIRNEGVLRAMGRVPRQKFIPPQLRDKAYQDQPLPIGEGQTISQPYMVAWMTELLEITKQDKVLEIGTGSGYQAAVLAELSGMVYTVERIAALSEKAQSTLSGLGYTNIRFMVGDGALGWKEHSPFDKIIVTAAADHAPAGLIAQLADGGKFVIPLGPPYLQQLTLIEKHGGKILSKPLGSCTFVPLIQIT